MKFLLALNRIPGLGSKRLEALLNAFGSGERVWQASPRELMKVPSIGKNRAYAVAKARSSIDPDEEMNMIKSMGISLLSLKDEGYPTNLKHIYDPPVLLYIKGQLETRDLASIAVVGSRKASSYGKRVARSLSTQLVESSITVVSGLARGIDTEAHKGALEGGGRTIAVMGSGLDVIYPPENERLFEEITRYGAVISEFPPGTPPEARNFPARNRIISGLSFGTVVVEAREGSGSLITANFALDQGREVFAVPGDIYRWGSRGTNGLIKDGAKLVESVQDILDEISFFDR